MRVPLLTFEDAMVGMKGKIFFEGSLVSDDSRVQGYLAVLKLESRQEMAAVNVNSLVGGCRRRERRLMDLREGGLFLRGHLQIGSSWYGGIVVDREMVLEEAVVNWKEC